mmetsp:Transcript_36195/g.95385  ORF Transcript_36195/g.95385 Transcript_36195/m.95385 type:complete len:271 (+) Transcript_36195:361-1173(+)
MPARGLVSHSLSTVTAKTNGYIAKKNNQLSEFALDLVPTTTGTASIWLCSVEQCPSHPIRPKHRRQSGGPTRAPYTAPDRAVRSCDNETGGVELQCRCHEDRDHRRQHERRIVSDPQPTSRHALVGFGLDIFACGPHGVRHGATGLARAEHAIPQPAECREGEVAAFVSLMMPIMVMRHLSKGQPALRRVGNVGDAAHASMLLEAFHDAEEAREPEASRVEGQQDLGRHLPDERIAKVIKPVILVGIARERVLRPVVDGVDVIPQGGNDM